MDKGSLSLQSFGKYNARGCGVRWEDLLFLYLLSRCWGRRFTPLRNQGWHSHNYWVAGRAPYDLTIPNLKTEQLWRVSLTQWQYERHPGQALVTQKSSHLGHPKGPLLQLCNAFPFLVCMGEGIFPYDNYSLQVWLFLDMRLLGQPQDTS